MLNTNETTLTVRLSKKLKVAITKAAKSMDLTVSQYIRRHFSAKQSADKERSGV